MISTRSLLENIRYVCETSRSKTPVINVKVIEVTNLEGWKEIRITIMFQNMGNKDNALDQPVQQKLDTLKKIMINEEIEILGLSEVNSNCSKILIK